MVATSRMELRRSLNTEHKSARMENLDQLGRGVPPPVIHVGIASPRVTEKTPARQLIRILTAMHATAEIVLAALHQVWQLKDQPAARLKQPSPFRQGFIYLPPVHVLKQMYGLHHISTSIRQRNRLCITQRVERLRCARVLLDVAVPPCRIGSLTCANIDFHYPETSLRNLRKSGISVAFHCHQLSRLRKSNLVSTVNGFPCSHSAAPSSHSNGTPATTASTATFE